MAERPKADDQLNDYKKSRAVRRLDSMFGQVGVTKHRTSPKPNIFRYVTFSNSQQAWPCQNVLAAGRTVHLSLFSREVLTTVKIHGKLTNVFRYLP